MPMIWLIGIETYFHVFTLKYQHFEKFFEGTLLKIKFATTFRNKILSQVYHAFQCKTKRQKLWKLRHLRQNMRLWDMPETLTQRYQNYIPDSCFLLSNSLCLIVPQTHYLLLTGFTKFTILFVSSKLFFYRFHQVL